MRSKSPIDSPGTTSKAYIYGRLKRLTQAAVHTFSEQEKVIKLRANDYRVQG